MTDLTTPAVAKAHTIAEYVVPTIGAATGVTMIMVHNIVSLTVGALTIVLLLLNIRSRLKRDAKDREAGRQ